MSDLYLIAHKVRGEPAFDIAQRLPELDEDGDEAWIIPTSGHRAFPYWAKPFDELIDNINPLPYGGPSYEFVYNVIPLMPSNWPDHYPTTASTTAPRQSLAERLGIKRPPAPTITRRI